MQKIEKKKNKFKMEIGYDLNKLMILNWMLGRLNKEGYKNWSFFIIINILLYLKKKKKKYAKKYIKFIIDKSKTKCIII